jgi:hypothetical protein
MYDEVASNNISPFEMKSCYFSKKKLDMNIKINKNKLTNAI